MSVPDGVWLLVRWVPAHAKVTGGFPGGWVCDICSAPVLDVDALVLAPGTDSASASAGWAYCDGCLQAHGGRDAVRALAVPCGCTGCEWARAAL